MKRLLIVLLFAFATSADELTELPVTPRESIELSIIHPPFALPQQPKDDFKAPKWALGLWGGFAALTYPVVARDVNSTFELLYVCDQIGAQCEERNPLARPFVRRGKPHLHVAAAAGATGVNLLSYWMLTQKRFPKARPFLVGTFWMPQVAVIATSWAAGTRNNKNAAALQRRLDRGELRVNFQVRF